MLIPNHPADERLSALASNDPDAIADRSLADHVTSCVRCTDSVEELGALRASLAELPDLHPNRPLRLLPDAAPKSDGFGSWVRRLFAPALTAGAALAVVGLVGTSGVTNQLYQNAGTDLDGADAEVGAEAPGEAAGAGASPVATYDSLSGAQRSSGEAPAVAGEDDSESFEPVTPAPTETSIFPILLVSGLAVIAVALLLRYVIVPRAG